MKLSEITSTQLLQEHCRSCPLDVCKSCELSSLNLCKGGILNPQADSFRKYTLRNIVTYVRKQKLMKLLTQ